MKLLIAIPTHEEIPVAFVECLMKLETRLREDGIQFETKFNSGTLVYIARDKLAITRSTMDLLMYCGLTRT
jgi:hypothetical protein